MKKKGFTLIELLAVIVILAIIALIATPIILNIIEKARKNAFVDTAYGLMDAAKLQYTENVLENKELDSSYTFPQTGTDILKFSGNEPEGGTLNIDVDGNIALAIHDGTWCVMKGMHDRDVSIQKYEEETCVIEEDATLEKCFTVIDHEKVTYTIHPTECVTYFTGGGMTTEKATAFCDGERVDGLTIDETIAQGYTDINELEQADAVVVTRTVDGVEIQKYLKNDMDCPMDVVIPRKIGGKTVVSIGNYAFVGSFDGEGTPTTGDSRYLTSVVLPSGLEKIGEGAFQGKYDDATVWNQLVTVDFSKAVNLQAIETGAFLGNQIAQVQLTRSTGLRTIGPVAFQNNAITQLNFGSLSQLESIGAGAFMVNSLTNVDFSGLTNLSVVGDGAFRYNMLSNITFGSLSALTTIGNQAFCNFDNSSPSFDAIPSSVTSNSGFTCS